MNRDDNVGLMYGIDTREDVRGDFTVTVCPMKRHKLTHLIMSNSMLDAFEVTKVKVEDRAAVSVRKPALGASRWMHVELLTPLLVSSGKEVTFYVSARSSKPKRFTATAWGEI